ncbi:MAG: hypothetical protein HYR96_08720 [Deltaproteobacteria bacterium]|nr:hypothetical protein [Deltaproteobacteria bacterium]MBI3296178.1 hypothetical protein [Deltaproteobacteria bacterium]
MRKFLVITSFCWSLVVVAAVQSRLTSLSEGLSRGQIELKNDSYNEAGGPAYLQLGFVKGEKAAVWIPVPAKVKVLKVDAFRVLINGQREFQDDPLSVFFQMTIARDGKYSTSIAPEIENAAQITAGPYWNDIPAQGARGRGLGCAAGGMLVGAALEFTHDGAPSVHRSETLKNPLGNLIYAIPGGWNLSQTYGVRGDWILRIMGHEAAAGECP